MGGLQNSLLVQFKGQRAISRLSDYNLIATVLEEKKNGEVDQVALAKAQMEAEGDAKNQTRCTLGIAFKELKTTIMQVRQLTTSQDKKLHETKTKHLTLRAI